MRQSLFAPRSETASSLNLQNLSSSRSQIYVTDGQSVFMSNPTCGQNQIVPTVRQLPVYSRGVPSLTRGQVLRLLLALASTVILRSESRWFHDHILLSQIPDYSNLGCQVPVHMSARIGGVNYKPRHWISLFLRVEGILQFTRNTSSVQLEKRQHGWRKCLRA
jgi:hypothetical protein